MKSGQDSAWRCRDRVRARHGRQSSSSVSHDLVSPIWRDEIATVRRKLTNFHDIVHFRRFEDHNRFSQPKWNRARSYLARSVCSRVGGGTERLDACHSVYLFEICDTITFIGSYWPLMGCLERGTPSVKAPPSVLRGPYGGFLC